MDGQGEIVIIGGGVIGVCSAYYLAQQGAQVMVIEQGEIASGSSYGNAGLIVPSHSIPLAAPGALGQGLRWMFDAESPFYIKPRFDLSFSEWLARFIWASRPGPMRRALPVLSQMLLASRALFDELAHAFDFEYQQKGAVLVYKDQRAFQSGMEEAHLLERYGIATRILDAGAVHTLAPALRPDVIGGVHYLQDAHLEPARFVRGLAAQAQALGVTFLTGTEVIDIESDRDRITTLRTTRGEVRPGQVILAVGAWSPLFQRMLPLKLPVQAGKGYSLTADRPMNCPEVPLMFAEARVVATPFQQGFRLAGTMELAGLDFSINARRVQALLRAARGYLSGLEQIQIKEIWRGLRPCTPDGLPIIARTRALKNLIVATGHAMLGISLGPITGKLVTQLIHSQKMEIALPALRLERF